MRILQDNLVIQLSSDVLNTSSTPQFYNFGVVELNFDVQETKLHKILCLRKTRQKFLVLPTKQMQLDFIFLFVETLKITTCVISLLDIII